MIIVVSKKAFRELQTAMLLQFFGFGAKNARRAMIGIACLRCRKERLGIKVETMWYRRYERF